MSTTAYIIGHQVLRFGIVAAGIILMFRAVNRSDEELIEMANVARQRAVQSEVDTAKAECEIELYEATRIGGASKKNSTLPAIMTNARLLVLQLVDIGTLLVSMGSMLWYTEYNKQRLVEEAKDARRLAKEWQIAAAKAQCKLDFYKKRDAS